MSYSQGEFSVVQFFASGHSEYVRRNVDAKSAVDAAHHYCNSVGAQIGTTTRVIITDGGDCTNFEWIFGRGVIYPPRDVSGTYVAEGEAS
jgi:hypothetical protein